MTKENLIKKYKHNLFLAEGKFTEGDFDRVYKGKESGRMQMGEMSPQRRELIISDAKGRLKEMERKFPWITGKEEKKPQENILKKIEESKKSKKS
jgi:hypothetical protein